MFTLPIEKTSFYRNADSQKINLCKSIYINRMQFHSKSQQDFLENLTDFKVHLALPDTKYSIKLQ